MIPLVPVDGQKTDPLRRSVLRMSHTFGPILALLTVIAIGTISYLQGQAYRKNSAYAEQSRSIVDQTEELVSLLTDAESSAGSIYPMSLCLLQASGLPMRWRTAPCRGQEGQRGSRNFPPEAARVLPGSAGLRCPRSVGVLCHDVPPFCHSRPDARDGALAAYPNPLPPPTVWAGY